LGDSKYQNNVIMKAQTKKPYRFGPTLFREQINNYPLKQKQKSVRLFRIINPPKDRRDLTFVILEETSFLALGTIYHSHFYKTEELMIVAYLRGLMEEYQRELTPREKIGGETRLEMIKRISKDTGMESFYYGREGYLSGFKLKNPGKTMPWFLAREGDEIFDNIIVRTRQRK